MSEKEKKPEKKQMIFTNPTIKLVADSVNNAKKKYNSEDKFVDIPQGEGFVAFLIKDEQLDIISITKANQTQCVTLLRGVKTFKEALEEKLGIR